MSMISESAEIHIYGACLANIIIATEPYTVQTLRRSFGWRATGGWGMGTGGATAQPASACRRQTRHGLDVYIAGGQPVHITDNASVFRGNVSGNSSTCIMRMQHI